MASRRIRLAPAVLMLAAVSLLGGCRRGSVAATAVGPAGVLSEDECPDRAEAPARCARLSVFENRATKSGRVIPLRIVVLRAKGANPAPDPVFYLAGGPGQAATEMVRPRSASGIRATRDAVFVDQRGTGGSNGLTCPFYGPPRDLQSYFDQFLPPPKVRACRERLEARADLTQYTTANSVDDLDEVRAALGYDRINLVGGSYGTRLAMEYVRRYEPHVRSVILDGALATSVHAPERFGQFAQRGLDLLLEECEADPACRRAFPSIREEARAVFQRLSAAPGRASVSHPAGSGRAEVVVTRENIAEAIRYMTYSSRDAANVPLFLHSAFEGNYAPIAEFLLRHRADGSFDGLYLSATCAEDVPFVSDSAERDDEPTYLGSYRIREQRAACAEWRRGSAPDWLNRPVSATVPVLLISGALDPVTIPDEAARIAATLPRSLRVTVPFGGHSYNGLSGIGCVDALRTEFIVRGGADGLDTQCVANISRPGFAVRH
jgi:pimeloyl-ACP methyl ester carboxylesterase